MPGLYLGPSRMLIRENQATKRDGLALLRGGAGCQTLEGGTEVTHESGLTVAITLLSLTMLLFTSLGENMKRLSFSTANKCNDDVILKIFILLL